MSTRELINRELDSSSQKKLDHSLQGRSVTDQRRWRRNQSGYWRNQLQWVNGVSLERIISSTA